MPAPARSPRRGALAALRILRPGNALIAAVGAYAGSFLVGAPFLAPPEVLAAMVAAFAFAAAGNVRNDLDDVDIDRVAHPDRPLVTGEVDRRVARLLAVHLYGLALAAGWLAASWTGLALVALAVPLMEGYERWGKSRGLPGNALIGVLTAAPFLLGGLAGLAALDALPDGGDGKGALAVVVDALAGFGRLSGSVWAVAGLACLATLGREVLKDVEDERADAGRRVTLPMRIGRTRAAWTAAGFLGAAALLSPLPVLLENVLGWGYLAAVGLADACFLTAALTGPRAPGRAQRLAKAGMVLALVALAAGRAGG